jgi:hypothetical protein
LWWKKPDFPRRIFLLKPPGQPGGFLLQRRLRRFAGSRLSAQENFCFPARGGLLPL